MTRNDNVKEQSMKAVGYVRVSPQNRAGRGLSLKHQEDKIKAHCEALDVDLIDIRFDAGSLVNR